MTGSVKLNSAGGGSVTLDTPSTASNYTVTLPSASGTLLNTGATSFTFAGAGTISATTTLTLNGGAGSNGLVLDASNNVGIGTSSPGQKLDVAGAIRTSGAPGVGAVYVNVTSAGAAGALTLLRSGTVKRYVGLDSSDNFAVIDTGGGSQMVVDSSGNLGLGVTPSAWFNNFRALEFSTGAVRQQIASGGFGISNNSYYNGTNWIYKTSTGASYYDQYQGAHYWATAPSGTAGNAISFTQAMTLDASGRLIVGDTVTNGPGAINGITQSSSNNAGSFGTKYAGDVGNAAILIWKTDNNNTTSQVFQRFAINNNGTANGQINANGSNAAAFGSWSDSRLKENIIALPNQLANICALKPSEFDYKDGSGHQIGFIAQEMQEVYPDVVGEGEDGMLTITGWSKTEARLVKAIQELAAKNSELESRLAALEGK